MNRHVAAIRGVSRVKKLAIHFGADASRQVRTMLDRQNVDGMKVNQRDFGSGAIGHLDGGALPSQGNVCFFTGVPINGPDARQLTDVDSAARLFPNWDGAFIGVFFDEQREILVVATDCLGMQPLYIRDAGGELTLVSETKALRGEPDLAAWGAFISVGHPIGDRSLMSGLQRVPPASVLTYDCARRRLAIRRYWDWPEPSDAWRNYDFLGALEQDVRAYAALGDPGTLLLSGGFDSRLLLFLLQRAQIPADALIVAHDDEHGDADGRLAEAVARIAGVRYRKARPPADFFSSPAYLDYLRASDVGYPSLGLFIAKVASQIDAPAIWDGLMPGVLLNSPHQSEGGFDSHWRKAIQGPESTVWRAAKALFRRDVVGAMHEGFEQDLWVHTSRLPQDSYGPARFVVQNRARNRPAMNPLKAYSNRADAFIPGLSKHFVAHAVTIPFQEKQHAAVYRSLIARLDKRALAIPFLSGGQLLKGNRIGALYLAERVRATLGQFRTRHPRLFTRGHRSGPRRSAFLGGHLFEESDACLNPDVQQRLQAVTPDNELAWNLLFHWKAWQWLHQSRLLSMLADAAR